MKKENKFDDIKYFISKLTKFLEKSNKDVSIISSASIPSDLVSSIETVTPHKYLKEPINIKKKESKSTSKISGKNINKQKSKSINKYDTWSEKISFKNKSKKDSKYSKTHSKHSKKKESKHSKTHSKNLKKK